MTARGCLSKQQIKQRGFKDLRRWQCSEQPSCETWNSLGDALNGVLRPFSTQPAAHQPQMLLRDRVHSRHEIDIHALAMSLYSHIPFLIAWLFSAYLGQPHFVRVTAPAHGALSKALGRWKSASSVLAGQTGHTETNTGTSETSPFTVSLFLPVTLN